MEAGERVRQDYELSAIDAGMLQAQADFDESENDTLHHGVAAARARLSTALKELGPGLAEVAIECCCLQNGIEVTEKKMGCSARSGKVVLRIALKRLIQHYNRTEGKFAPMIG